MGRHAPRIRASRAGRWLLVVLLVGVLGAGAGVLATGGRAARMVADVRERVSPTPTCPETIVRVAASPDVAPAVRAAVEPLQGRALAGGSCLSVDVQGSTPEQVLAAARGVGDGATSAQLGRLPQLWVPDAGFWVDRFPDAVPVASLGSLATSPVVLATSTSTARDLGWTAPTGPAWAEAVTGVRPVAVDLISDTCGVATALALQDSLGTGKEFRQALVALTLAVDKATGPGATAPLDLVGGDSPATPLIPMTEQTVLAQRKSGRTALAMSYPKDGSPFLDYPLVTVAKGRWEPGVETAAAQVAAALQAPAAADAFSAQGFRAPDGSRPPAGDGVLTTPLRRLPLPGGAAVQQTVQAVARLAAPTRMLAVIDVSGSMAAKVAPGVSRIGLVIEASKRALAILPAKDSVGTWAFSSRMDGDQDWKEINPIERLDATDDGSSHREKLLGDLTTLPTYLNRRGTSIYDTVDAAVKHVQAGYDPRAENVVVVLTDGQNDDRLGLSLDALVSRLEKSSKERGVRVVAIGIGPGTDQDALTRLAEATPNGKAYLASKPEDLGKVLVEAIAARR